MAAARGHFETFPVRYGAIGHPDGGSCGWRFVDDQGQVRAICSRGFESEAEAAADAGEFVIAIRTSTYGQRFAEEIAGAVQVLDKKGTDHA